MPRKGQRTQDDEQHRRVNAKLCFGRRASAFVKDGSMVGETDEIIYSQVGEWLKSIMISNGTMLCAPVHNSSAELKWILKSSCGAHGGRNTQSHRCVHMLYIGCLFIVSGHNIQNHRSRKFPVLS